VEFEFTNGEPLSEADLIEKMIRGESLDDVSRFIHITAWANTGHFDISPADQEAILKEKHIVSIRIRFEAENGDLNGEVRGGLDYLGPMQTFITEKQRSSNGSTPGAIRCIFTVIWVPFMSYGYAYMFGIIIRQVDPRTWERYGHVRHGLPRDYDERSKEEIQVGELLKKYKSELKTFRLG
jgi:hypothetical protein